VQIHGYASDDNIAHTGRLQYRENSVELGHSSNIPPQLEADRSGVQAAAHLTLTLSAPNCRGRPQPRH
jgi:hypothetical protein